MEARRFGDVAEDGPRLYEACAVARRIVVTRAGFVVGVGNMTS